MYQVRFLREGAFSLLLLSALLSPPAEGNSGSVGSSGNDGALQAGDWLKTQATTAANQQLDAFLGQFGTVSANLNSGSHFDGSSLDILLPLAEQQNALFFSQWGWRHKDARNTLNLGVGYRYLLSNGWMAGGNVFMDADVTGENRRMGLGAELWRDYLKLSVNGYVGTTDWHDAYRKHNYDEKVANGFDVRAEGFLPQYPQLSGVLVYERYYGQQVALFDEDDLQNNPYAITAGIHYTPIPLLSLSVDQKAGSDQQHDTRIGLNLTWRPGVPLNKQWDPQAVQATRTLSVSRYDLADRNYDVVLQYKAVQRIRVSLPAQIQGYEGDTAQITASVSSDYPLDHITWDTGQLTAAGGSWRPLSATTIEITFPPYQANKDNTYEIGALASDIRGNRSEEAHSTVRVMYDDQGNPDGHLILLTDNAMADGKAQDVVQATLTDSEGHPLAGQKVQFQASNGAHISPESGVTDAQGQAQASLTSTVAGDSTITASTEKGGQRIVTAHFVSADANGELTLLTDNAMADGKAQDVVQATLTDSEGHPLAGQKVQFQASNGAHISPESGVTDAQGQAQASLTSTEAGESTVTASTEKGGQRVVMAHFISQSKQLSLSTVRDGAMGNYVETDEVEATVTDSQGKAVSGEHVHFSTPTSFAKVDSSEGVTDASGKARTTVRSSIAVNTVTVKADIDSGESQETTVHFYPLTYKAEVVKNNSPADGVTPNTFTMALFRQDGNPASGKRVIFTTDSGDVQLSSAVIVTDSQGRATVNMVSSSAVDYVLKAEVEGVVSYQQAMAFRAP